MCFNDDFWVYIVLNLGLILVFFWWEEEKKGLLFSRKEEFEELFEIGDEWFLVEKWVVEIGERKEVVIEVLKIEFGFWKRNKCCEGSLFCLELIWVEIYWFLRFKWFVLGLIYVCMDLNSYWVYELKFDWLLRFKGFVRVFMVVYRNRNWFFDIVIIFSFY